MANWYLFCIQDKDCVDFVRVNLVVFFQYVWYMYCNKSNIFSALYVCLFFFTKIVINNKKIFLKLKHMRIWMLLQINKNNMSIEIISPSSKVEENWINSALHNCSHTLSQMQNWKTAFFGVFFFFYQISDHAYQWNYNFVENMKCRPTYCLSIFVLDFILIK